MTVRFERTSGGGTLIVLWQPPDPSKMGPKAYARRLEQDRKAQAKYEAYVEKCKALDAILKPLLAKRFAR